MTIDKKKIRIGVGGILLTYQLYNNLFFSSKKNSKPRKEENDNLKIANFEAEKIICNAELEAKRILMNAEIEANKIKNELELFKVEVKGNEIISKAEIDAEKIRLNNTSIEKMRIISEVYNKNKELFEKYGTYIIPLILEL